MAEGSYGGMATPVSPAGSAGGGSGVRHMGSGGDASALAVADESAYFSSARSIRPDDVLLSPPGKAAGGRGGASGAAQSGRLGGWPHLGSACRVCARACTGCSPCICRCAKNVGMCTHIRVTGSACGRGGACPVAAMVES